MTCCGSSRRAISGFSGNCGLRFSRSICSRTADRVILGFGMMDDHCGGGLLREKLERFGEVHAKRFLGGEQLEHGRVVIEIGTRSVSPRVPLAAWDTELLLDAAVRPLRHRLSG